MNEKKTSSKLKPNFNKGPCDDETEHMETPLPRGLPLANSFVTGIAVDEDEVILEWNTADADEQQIVELVSFLLGPLSPSEEKQEVMLEVDEQKIGEIVPYLLGPLSPSEENQEVMLGEVDEDYEIINFMESDFYFLPTSTVEK